MKNEQRVQGVKRVAYIFPYHNVKMCNVCDVLNVSQVACQDYSVTKLVLIYENRYLAE